MKRSIIILEEHLRKRNQIVYESETLHNVESTFQDKFFEINAVEWVINEPSLRRHLYWNLYQSYDG